MLELQMSVLTQLSAPHPGYFNNSTLCDLFVHVEASSTLKKGDGFPQVSLRHPNQCCYALKEWKLSALHELLKKAFV